MLADAHMVQVDACSVTIARHGFWWLQQGKLRLSMASDRLSWVGDRAGGMVMTRARVDLGRGGKAANARRCR